MYPRQGLREQEYRRHHLQVENAVREGEIHSKVEGCNCEYQLFPDQDNEGRCIVPFYRTKRTEPTLIAELLPRCTEASPKLFLREEHAANHAL